MLSRSTREIDPRKVAVYVRWSTEDQGDGTTLDVQLSGCRHYVLSQGWEVRDDLIFIDDGYSGGTLDRPAMKRLRAAVRKGEVECVVVLKLDRLSRSVVDTVNLVLREWGDLCYIKSARENIDTTNQAGKMFFYILVSYAEWERSVIKERTWSGKIKRAEEVRNPGHRAQFGYRWDDSNHLVIVPEEANIVRRVFNEALNGRGTVAIASGLNDDGILTREGRLWSQVTIRRMLKHPVYKGDWYYGVTKRNPNYGQREGERWHLPVDQPLVSVKGGVSPIVDGELWEAVQAALKSRDMVKNRRSGRAYSSAYLLTGIAQCKCGFHLSGRNATGGRTTNYYVCSGTFKGKVKCGYTYIRQDVLDKLVVDTILRKYRERVAKDQFLDRWLEAHAQNLQMLQHGQDELRDRELALAKEEAHVSKLLRKGQITPDEYRRVIGDTDRERNEIAAKLTEVEQAVRELQAQRGHRIAIEQMLERLDRWEELPAADRKHIVRQLVTSLVVHKPARGELQVHLVLKTDDPDLSAHTEISEGTSA